MKFTRDLLSSRNQKGIAIILAVFCTVLIVYLVNEVTYETNVEYLIHAQSVNRLKAYYAARSGVELSLLRIKIYKKVQKQFGKNLGSQAGLLNMIWSFPLSWPPVLPEEVSGVEKEVVQDKVQDSLLDATFTTTILDEGSKIDLNDLASPSKTIREATKNQLLRVFNNKIENDRDWARDHADLQPSVLVNNIIDWVDEDTQSLNSGGERDFYPKLPSTITTPFPPNRGFRTLEELRLVAGMTNDYFELLAPQVTVYGAKAINPNSASRDVIKSLDPSITDEVVTAFLKRREDPSQGGHFKKADEFWDYLNSQGARVPQETQQNVPLTFEAVLNFRIRSVGEYKGSIREIEAVVMDIEASAAVVAEKIKKENQANAGGAGGAGATQPQIDPLTGRPVQQQQQQAGAGSNNNQTPSKGPPRVVYWFEK